MIDANHQGDGLVSTIARHVRDAIMSGEFAPGTWIRQEELAKLMVASRSPVREALRLLESEGLVSLKRNAGARVTTLRSADLVEIYLIREQLEPLALADSVQHLEEPALERLWTVLEEMERAAGHRDLGEWVRLDREFHLLSLSGTTLGRVLQIAHTMWNSSQQYRLRYVQEEARLGIAQLEHHLLVDAFNSRDGDRAKNLATIHIRRTLEALRGELLRDDGPGMKARV